MRFVHLIQNIKYERLVTEVPSDEHFRSSTDVTWRYLELQYALAGTGILFWAEIMALLSTYSINCFATGLRNGEA